jgi:hypothetical protein
MRTSVQKRRYQLQLSYYLISAAPAGTAVSMFVYGNKIDVLLQDRQPILNELQARLEGNDPKFWRQRAGAKCIEGRHQCDCASTRRCHLRFDAECP